MQSFQESMNEYRRQLEQGAIQEAYRGLMHYLSDLRTFFQNQYPDHVVSGSLYTGMMDMTYFSFYPESLKARKLKVAIVFLHETFRFEVWLGGVNKQVQKKYWDMFKVSGWCQYHIVPTIQGVDAIVEHTLVDQPDFSDLESLSRLIERGTLKFIKDIESFLATHE